MGQHRAYTNSSRQSWRRQLAAEICTALTGAALIIRCAATIPGAPGFTLFAGAFLVWPWFVQPLVEAAGSSAARVLAFRYQSAAEPQRQLVP